MSYKQGFLTGLKITLIVALLSPLTQYLTHTFITPEYLENIRTYSITNELLTPEQAEQTFSLSSYMIQGVIGSLIMGLITSVVLALFTKRKPKRDSMSPQVS